LAIDKTTPKINAHKNPSTINPGTMLLTSKINSAFKTKLKRPKVRIVIGNVKITRTGFKKAFIIPKTRATTRAEVKLVM
jgi:hypothetical protein